MPAVNFVNEHKVLDVMPGTNLRKTALKSGIPLYNSLKRVFDVNLQLGPLAIPSRFDVVEIVEGKGVNPRSPDEEERMSGLVIKKKVTPTMRLASYVQVNGDITVKTMPVLEIDKARTMQNLGYLGVLSGFVLLMGIIFGMIGLDLVKKL